MIQQRKVRLSILSFLLFFCYSVVPSFALGVNFTERASFYEDESGLFSFKVDLTKSRKLVAWVQYLHKDYQDITQLIGYKPLCILQEALKHVPDISDVLVESDQKMLSFTLKFGFKNIHALNQAMRIINKGLDPPEITYFSLSKELFIREDLNGIAKKLIYYQPHARCLIKSLDLAAFFKHTTYTTIHTFYKKIKDYSNPLSALSKNKKTIRITHHILAEDETEESISNRCHFD